MLSIPALASAILFCSTPLLWLPVIPQRGTILLLLSGALILAGLPGQYRRARYLALYGLLLCWNLLAARQVIDLFATFGEQALDAEVKIIRSDGEQRHEIQLMRINQGYLFPAPGVMLYRSELAQPVCAGQRWLMRLRLRPIHGKLNQGTFNSQRYALSQQIQFSGRVLSATRLTGSCNLRARWLRKVESATRDLEWQGVIVALGFGERINVSAEVKKIMRDTGTAHLMAISGLHIALAGGIGWLLARGVQIFFPAFLIGYRLPLLLGVAMALFYSWLAGMNPPALRTVIGMGIWAALRLSGRQWSAWEVLLCCVAGIIFSDPLALLADSLWLSVLAVVGLIFWYQWVPLPRKWSQGYRRPLINLLYLQCGVTLLLTPLQLALFHGLSLTSLVANLFAIPAITFISVPLILAGMTLGELPAIGEAIWFLADRSLAAVFALLAALPAGWIPLDRRFSGLAFVAWWLVIILRCGLWRSSPALAVAPLLLMLFPFWRKAPEQSWALHMLDVGHGLAIVIEKQGKALLYDSGNAWPEGDSARQTIIPWLQWRNLTPQQIVISHEHRDHIGGLASLQQRWPRLEVRSSLGMQGHQPCFRGQQWHWQGLQFTVLWPPRESLATGNNRSCVLMVSSGAFRALLTGDLEGEAEIAMLRNQWRWMQADVIQVPHHGSKTSSGIPLLRIVAGSAALASAARYSPWRLPAASVVKRYRQQGYRWYDTAHSGQLSVVITGAQWRILGFREQILPRWYHQWFGVTGDNG